MNLTSNQRRKFYGDAIMRWHGILFVCAHFLLTAALPVSAEEQTRSILDLSLEELANATVTSVSKHEQKLSEAPAAIFVLTHEDIRHSGAATIPEVLRLVPGLNVAAVDNTTWAISARGFNSDYANKLLVMIDGRSVYSPIFSGVNWDDQEILLSTIERIEVIRGPGGTLWGANAVNGIINIITKKAKDTQGTQIELGGGKEIERLGSVRHGGALGDIGFFRFYGKGSQIGRGNDMGGNEKNFGQNRRTTAGFRIDGEHGLTDKWTVSGDGSTGSAEDQRSVASFSPPYYSLAEETGERRTGNLLARWEHVLNQGSETSVQFYLDRVVRNAPDVLQRVTTADFDFQHHYANFNHQNLVWGMSFRQTADRFAAHVPLAATLDPDAQHYRIWSGFLQDDIALADTLHLILGSKLERNDFSGWDLQPTAQARWTPHREHTLWTSVSRAVRTPARVDRGITIDLPGQIGPNGLPVFIEYRGNPDFQSESLVAFETGYRVNATKNLSFDVATFFNSYDRLDTPQLDEPMLRTNAGGDPYLLVPAKLVNGAAAKTYGMEALVDWRPLPIWRLQAWYSFLSMDLRARPGYTLSVRDPETQSPQHQAMLRSLVDLPYGIELDSSLRYVDSLRSMRIKSYMELNMRLGWKQNQNLEWAIVGQNLLHEHHPEFATTIGDGAPSAIERAIFATVKYRF